MAIEIWNRGGNADQVSNSEVGINGTLLGTTTFSSSKWSNGPLIDGNGEGIQFMKVPAIAGGAMSCIYKPTFDYNSGTRPTYDAQIFGYDATGSNRISADFYLGNIRMVISGHTTKSYSYPFLANEEMAIVMRWATGGLDGGSETAQFYINGVQVMTGTGGITALNQTSIILGNRTGPGYSRAARANLANFKYYDSAEIDISNDMNTEGFGGAKRRIA